MTMGLEDQIIRGRDQQNQVDKIVAEMEQKVQDFKVDVELLKL